MANNPNVNKVELADGTVLIDISADTVDAGSMLYGVTAHSASGESITGNIANKSSSDLSVSGDTVTVPAGYYASQASASVSSGSITNNTSGGTSSGTVNRGKQIKIGAGYYPDDLYYTAQSNSGTYTISSSGTKTVNGYYYASVAAGSTTVAEPTIDSSTGIVTAEATVTAGYQSAGTESNTLQLTTKAATTYNVSSSAQTIAAGTYLTGAQTIRAVTTSNITAANIKDGTTITVGDAGSSTRIKNVTGTFTDASTVSSGQTAATAAKILSGYSAWVDGSEVKGSISSKAATTYYTSSSDQTISSGQYLSGKQTIKAVTTSNLTAENIKSGVTVKVGDSSNAGRIASITGTYTPAYNMDSVNTSSPSGATYGSWTNNSRGYCLVSGGTTRAASVRIVVKVAVRVDGNTLYGYNYLSDVANNIWQDAWDAAKAN